MESNETGSALRLTHKELLGTIEKQLEAALAGWKDELGEQRFRKRIRKSGKVFGKKIRHSGIAPAERKNSLKGKKKEAA